MISESLLRLVQDFDASAAAKSHVERDHADFPGPIAASTIDDLAGRIRDAIGRLQSKASIDADWTDFHGPIRELTDLLSPELWPEVLIELTGDCDPQEWMREADAGGFPSADDSPDLVGAFAGIGGFQPGLSLGSLRLVSLRVPPCHGLLEWMETRHGVAALWNGSEPVSLPEPEVATDRLWDGHDIVLNKTEGRYPSWYDPRSAGKGVLIAVVDTGIASEHDAFRGKIADRIDLTGEGLGDRAGHGSHCAGIAAAAPFGPQRYHGVAPAAKLLDAKVINRAGHGAISGILRGLEWARRRGAHVVSISLGVGMATNGRSLFSRAVQSLVDQGVFVSVSAGNDGPGSGTITVPGDAAGACTVGAVDVRRTVCPFSSRGPTRHENPNARQKPELCAPGSRVAGPAAPRSRFFPYDRKDAAIGMDGTSMAAPFVAGAAAVVWATRKGRKLNPAGVKRLFAGAALPATGPGSDDRNVVGAGLLSVHKAVASIQGVAGPASSRTRRVAAAVAAAAVVAVGLLLWFGDPSAVGRVLGEDPLEQPIEAADTSSTTFDAPDRQRTDATDPAEREAVWRRPSCYQLDVDRARLNLTVYGGMTLSELAQHFRTTMSELRRVNPSLRSGQLVAGRSYVIPVDHLQAARHVVAPGETLSRLSALYDAPSPYSIRTWNCLGSNTIRRGDRLLVFADPSQTDGTPIEERERQALAPDLARAGCFEYWEDRDELRLKVFRGMTISDLSVHMRLSPAEVRRACGAEGNKLIAGRECLFDVSHLRLQRTPVERGDNLWSLRRQYDCPSRFSIRAWNCLPNNQLRVGDRLALWLPGTRADSR